MSTNNKDFGASDEFDLGSFLDASIEETKILADIELKEREKAKRARERASEVDVHSLYAIKRENKVTGDLAFRAVDKLCPQNMCLVFGKDKHQTRYRGARYFSQHMYPEFAGYVSSRKMTRIRTYRAQNLDKYASKEVAPMPELLKAGFAFSCAACHKHLFTYEDYENKKCLIVEGEGNPIDYAEGFVLCYDCAKKYGYV